MTACIALACFIDRDSKLMRETAKAYQWEITFKLFENGLVFTALYFT